MDALTESLRRAFDGEEQAVEPLVDAFTAVIHARAWRALVRRGSRGRDPRQELEDLAQDVLCFLFRDDARVLRSWDPARGLSLLNFVGLVAEREIGHTLTSGRKNPWALDPTDDRDLERAAGEVHGPEAAVASRQTFDRVVGRLEEELSPKALELFRLLFVEELTVEDIAAHTGLRVDAVYTWRSRLLKRTRALLRELEDDGTTASRAMSAIPQGGSTR